ncbi:MAG: TIGR03089 family protein [Sporichthyaceae bacterium]|nr:TIGR03089 family protein [Sporichthyaceae bacterium]
MTPGTPAGLFRSAAALDPARPFITFYDDATGERVELSFASFENWVNKTANLIQDGLVAEPGQRISLLLPVHWQTLVWYLACWSAGVIAAPGLEPSAADHVITDPQSLAGSAGCTGERVMLSLRPLGLPSADPVPAGVLDYAIEVPGHGDRFTPIHPVPATAPALQIDGRTWTGAELVGIAERAATDAGLTQADRIMTSADLSGLVGLGEVLLGPLSAGAAIVLCRNPDPDRLAGRATMERITRTA